MPLSAPAAREPIHTRRITCDGFRRADGLWDIEGHLVDVKHYEFRNEFRGTITPGEPLHQMRLRLTVDDSLTIVAVEAVTENGPYALCPEITASFQALVGLRIRPGFTLAVKERLGGAKGCTHLVELLGPMATTAFQTVFPILSRERAAEADPRTRPVLLDSCHVFAADGDHARRHWPDFYTGPR
ncbi:DUF2889 domain-containing protein [Inquilinus sp. OTU3971]|uniref:DUF2889 domain-containing protein n=1 Tax=Inquilinus sp. OTU3971 TaxID=3043855 RepID=UPI00313B816C